MDTKDKVANDSCTFSDLSEELDDEALCASPTEVGAGRVCA